MRCAGYHEKMIGITYFGGDKVTQLNVVVYTTIKWACQPKHSPSNITTNKLLCLSTIKQHYLTSNTLFRQIINHNLE